MLNNTFILFSIFYVSVSFAADLEFSSKDGSVFKNEKIVSVLLNKDPEPSVLLISKNMSCKIAAGSFDESKSIVEHITKSGPQTTWVQCYSDKFDKPNGPNSIYVSTNRYTLGKKLN
jgi:hypothetical protein